MRDEQIRPCEIWAPGAHLRTNRVAAAKERDRESRARRERLREDRERAREQEMERARERAREARVRERERIRALAQGCRKFQTVQYNKVFKPKLSDKKCVILRHFATFYKVRKLQNFLFK